MLGNQRTWLDSEHVGQPEGSALPGERVAVGCKQAGGVNQDFCEAGVHAFKQLHACAGAEP